VNPSIKVSTSAIYITDDLVDDAFQAESLTLHASNKTDGTGNGGDLLLNSGTSVGGTKGDVRISANLIRLDAPLAADPVSGVAGDIYYNTVTNKFKYHNDTTWLPLGSGSGLIKVDLYDPVTTILPIGTVVVDGVTVNADNLVLFGSALLNKIYKAVGTGPVISGWTAELAFDNILDPTVPSTGDTVMVRSGTGYGMQIGKYTSTAWVFNDKVRYFNGLNYFEESAINTSAIANNVVVAADIFTVAFLGSENLVVDYSLKRGTAKEIGTLFISTDGTDVSIGISGSSISTTGVVFSAIIDGTDIKLQYTSDNSGSSGEMKYGVKRWSDTAGGPAGVPSYSSSGSSSVFGSGAAQQIAIWNGTNTVTGSDHFKINTAALTLNMGLAEMTILDSDNISAGVYNNLELFTYPDTYRFVVVDYSVTRGTTYRVGSLHIIHDGTSVNVTDTYSDIGDTNIELASPFVTHTVSGGFVSIKCNSIGLGGDAGTLKKVMTRWS
jgi:hypothetical protein